MSTFDTKALLIMDRAIKVWGLKPYQAAGFPGNFGRETGGFTHFQELRPVAGRGGLGWAQWTGPRRVRFERFCAESKLSPLSDEGNWRFLRQEVDRDYPTLIPRLRKTVALREAVALVEEIYESAGVVALEDRVYWGRKALLVYQAREAIAKEGGKS